MNGIAPYNPYSPSALIFSAVGLALMTGVTAAVKRYATSNDCELAKKNCEYAKTLATMEWPAGINFIHVVPQEHTISGAEAAAKADDEGVEYYCNLAKEICKEAKKHFES